MSGTSVVSYNPQQKKAPAKPAIDAVNDHEPPLNYSFYKLSAVQEVCDEEPRPYALKKGAASPRVSKDKKSKSQGIRLNNNQLTDIKLMTDVAGSLFSNPASMGWIDLSYNELTIIDPVLLEFENLEILYLHGNNIEKIQEVDKLHSLKKLFKLTLHGNPVEEVKGYKQYVISTICTLRCLDFSSVTKADRKTAETWNKMINKPSKKKKKDMD